MTSRRIWIGAGLVAVLGWAGVTASAGGAEKEWTRTFDVRSKEWVSEGRNPWFVLEPGYQLLLTDGEEELLISVLDETKTVHGVTTRIVEERESEGGELVEVSRNYFAMSTRTNSVYYFGEEVDIYKDGKVANHAGAWESGVDGAHWGLAMPGEPLLGARYFQEIAPGVAMDRAEIISTSSAFTTPAGVFKQCLVTEESSPLEPGHTDRKTYGGGIGLLQDGSLKLTRYGKNIAPRV